MNSYVRSTVLRRYERTFSDMCMKLVFSMCLTFFYVSFYCVSVVISVPQSVSTYLLLHCIV